MQQDGGSSSSSRPHNASVGQRPPPRVAPSVFPAGNPSVSPPQHSLAPDTSSGTNSQWIYTPSAAEGAHISPPASMIASVSSYYDGDHGSPQERANAQQYQQWVYTAQQSQQPSQQQSYRRDAQPISQMQQHQFTFAQGVYPGSSSYDQYPRSGNATAQQGTGPIEYTNERPSYQQQGSDVYGSYYNDILSVGGNTAHSSPENSGPTYQSTTPESATLHSYNTTPDPAYAAQRQQSQYLQNPVPQHTTSQLQQPRQHSNQPHSQHYSNTTYSRDSKLNQPPTLAQTSHLSSQSPPSSTWTENTTISSVNATSQNTRPSSSGTSLTNPPTQTARPVNLKRQLGTSDSAPAASTSSTGGKTAQKRKRRKNNERQDWGSAFDEDKDSDESDYEDHVGISVGMGGLGVVSEGVRGKSMRLPGACTHCKKLKMKCDFPRGDNTCKRCKTGGHVCIVEGRKQRTAPK